MKEFHIKTSDGDTLILYLSDDGYCYCPVCGVKSMDKDWRPYDDEGNPSYDICFCGFEYGFDDGGDPPYYKSWESYRKKWLSGKVDGYGGKKLSLSQKLEQLKNIKVQ